MFFLFDRWRGTETAAHEVPSPHILEMKMHELKMEVHAIPVQSAVVLEEKKQEEKSTEISGDAPSFDRLNALFTPDAAVFPFVETISYKSKVPWLSGRSAWIVDYASHYKTSRHFIARSLNGAPDYFQQEAKEGDRFNILSLDYPFHFHLLLDLSRKQLWLGVVHDESKKVDWLKNYSVCTGRKDSSRLSGYLTPVGTYALGDRIAVYNSESKGFYQGEKVEMLHYFGTRWIPFEKEIKDCSAPAKSYGIHGVPWVKEDDEWKEDCSSLGQAQSDGCIRLKTSDMEELYAIISSRPATTTIEITHDYAKADLKL